MMLETIKQNAPNIKGIYSDSRKIVENTIFVAIKGTQVDGHNYIQQAIDKGAAAIVCQEVPENLNLGSATIHKVEDSSLVMGEMLSEFHEHPSRKLKLVGVTGTNGKTTVATLLYDLFRSLGHKVGLISTVCNYIDGQVLSSTHTTPEANVLHALIADMHLAGCEYVFMEVSSHAVDQKRIAGLHFTGGIFTNLTRDHLDYHLTTANYLNAKKRFFDELSKNAFAITNIDDKVGLVMLQNSSAKGYTYSMRNPADYKAKVLESHFDGTELLINGKEVIVQLVGAFNAYNLLAVYAAAECLGKKSDEILLALSTLRPVAGRFQTIYAPKGYVAIVDYAHTPDAIVNVITSILDVMNGNGKLITVVGCGGNRDKGKRPVMAKEAARLSNKLILTSDNPRFEEPDDIISDMSAGLNSEEMQRVISIADRKQAIKTATLLAEKGDVILIAGKGHENYQEIKGVKYHFDDREILEEMF